MGTVNGSWRRFRTRLVGGLALPLFFPLSPACTGEIPLRLVAQATPLVAPATTKPSQEGAQTQPAALTLADAIHTALDKQPAIAAYRASLAAAETARQAVANIKVPT